MSTWSIVAIVAIAVWGIVQVMKARHGIISDSEGNEQHIAKDTPETQRELEDLRERIKVLERIATDGNSLDAVETKRIADEIEALRGKEKQ